MSNPFKTPYAWETIDSVTIIDPDGWRVDGKSFDEPIDREEWDRRMSMSTISIDSRSFLSELTRLSQQQSKDGYR